MFDKTAIKEKGKKFEYGHDKTGRMIKVTKLDGKEVSREFLNARIVWPGGVSIPPSEPTEPNRLGVANLGINKFKRDNPDASYADIQAYKEGAWAMPIAQMQIEVSAMPEKGKKK